MIFDGLLRRAFVFWIGAVVAMMVGGPQLGQLVALVVLVVGAEWCGVYVWVALHPEKP